ncbi:MAG: hypothetical protein ACT4QB_00080 [Gammaproteobacteria bacterium]
MRRDSRRVDSTRGDPTRADSAKCGTGSGKRALATLALAALLAAEPATAQLASRVAILQCAVISDPPGSTPEISVVAFSRSGTDVPSVQLGRECARGLLVLLARRFVIRSTLGDQAAGTVLYTLTRR